MDTYSILREVADSWVLLAMFTFFVLTVLWVFRPGNKEVHENIADIPFRHENKPASDGAIPGAQHKEARQ